MKCTKCSFAVICLVLTVPLFLSTGRLSARDADLTLAAAHTAKQQCMNTCRARYHDCVRVDQLPTWQCRGVYRDCTRYTCTGLGPRMTDVLFAVVSDLIDLDQIDDENILQTKLPMRHLTRGLKTLRRARLG